MAAYLSPGVAALLTLGVFVFGTPQAGATTFPTFTWSGADEVHSSLFSDGANWVGGQAPSPQNGAANLVFPAQCGEPSDDIIGLLANSVTFNAPGGAGATTCEIAGNANGAKLTVLDGGLTVQAGITSGIELNGPVFLGANQTWTIDSPLTLESEAPLSDGSSGGRFTLNAVIGDGSTFEVGSTVDVAAITLSGANSSDTGANASLNGNVFLDGSATASLNGSDGKTVFVNDVELSGVGTTGPLVTSGADLTIGAASGTPGAVATSAFGPTTLDSAAVLGFPLYAANGAASPTLSVGGPLSLNSAHMTILDSCPSPLGTVSTLISAPQGLSGQLTDLSGNPITNGEIVGPNSSFNGTCAAGSTEDFFRINYTGTSVTATTVPTPTTTVLTTSNGSPVLGQAFTLTATVTENAPASGNPIGTVTFNGAHGPVCSNVALSGVPPTATCVITPVVTGSFNYTATFTPGAGDISDAGSSSNTVTETVSVGPRPVMAASPTSINFGTLRAGLISDPTTVTLTNNGPGNEILNGFVFTGADPNDFVGFTTCGTSTTPAVLLPGKSCTIDVSFAPTIDGARSANLTLVDNEATPLQVPLSGVGTVGYYVATGTGRVFNFGDAGWFGDLSHIGLRQPIVGVTATPDGDGYWLVASDGGVFAFGDAPFYGSTGNLKLNKPVVGMAATPDGGGYWLVASDGGIFTFGDAQFFGSTGSLTLNKPIVGMAPTPDGLGYWLVASDGGIFAFGDAQFFGSTGSLTLNKPIVGMAPMPDAGGYWLVASDGGVFAFGDANFFGSAAPFFLNQPIVGIAATPDGGGYWMVSADGGVFTFGDATFGGSVGGDGVHNAVGIAGTAPPAAPFYLGVFYASDRRGAVLHSHVAGTRALTRSNL